MPEQSLMDAPVCIQLQDALVLMTQADESVALMAAKKRRHRPAAVDAEEAAQ